MNRRGFTLLETLVTLLLVGLVFGLVMTLLIEGMRIVRSTNQRDESVQAASVALDRLICELREASAVVQPSGVMGTSSQIEFVKVDPSSATRIPGPLSASWDPQDPAFHLQVRYRLDASGTLLREVGPQGGGYQEISALAAQVSGLQGLRRSQGVYAVVLSVRCQQVIQSHCGTALCPLLR